MSNSAASDPDDYVEKNKDTLVYIIKHSSDDFVRALCLAALVEYGDTPAEEVLLEEFEDIDRLRSYLNS